MTSIVGCNPTETLLINGRWLTAPSTFEVRNPATLSVIDVCAECTDEQAAAAVDAAADALDQWGSTSADARGSLLERLAAGIDTHREIFKALLVGETGKPRVEAQREVSSSIDYLRWFAAEGRRAYERTTPLAASRTQATVVRQPVGVVLAITPWNYPLNTLCRKLGPALAAGCTLIVKPAPETPLSTVLLGRVACEAGVPAGVLNVITTTRAAALTALWMNDARVNKVAFTGSTAVGRELIRASAGHVQRLSLELGGNAPALVFEDADIEAAASAIVASRYRHSGQTCVCVQRVFAQESVSERLLSAVVAKVRSLRTGSGDEDAIDCGPLIREAAALRAAEHVADAVSRGAELLAGGRRLFLPAPNAGVFFEPTVLARVPQAARVMQDEVFAPVLACATFRSDDEAIQLANATPYGLAAYLFTGDGKRARQVAPRVRAGAVGVNTAGIVFPQLPFGGVGASGLGRENGPEGLDEYLETKAIITAD